MFMISNSCTDATIIRAVQEGNTLVRVTVAVTTPTGEETETATLSIPEILPKWWEWDAHTVRRRVVDVAPEPVKNAVSNYLLWALPTNLPETGEVTIR